MVNYQNGKIYKLVPKDPIIGDENIMYIGSTAEKYLSMRLSKHVATYRQYQKNKGNYVTSYKLFEKYGIENIVILLIETFPCNNKDELHKRERHYIENNVCTNKSIPTQTDAEYRLKNRETLLQKQKEYVMQNKEKIRKNEQEIMQCECGITFTKQHKSRHLKTENHQKFTQMNDMNNTKYMKCNCGAFVLISCKTRHLKSQKHQKLLGNINHEF